MLLFYNMTQPSPSRQLYHYSAMYKTTIPGPLINGSVDPSRHSSVGVSSMVPWAPTAGSTESIESKAGDGNSILCDKSS